MIKTDPELCWNCSLMITEFPPCCADADAEEDAPWVKVPEVQDLSSQLDPLWSDSDSVRSESSSARVLDSDPSCHVAARTSKLETNGRDATSWATRGGAVRRSSCCNRWRLSQQLESVCLCLPAQLSNSIEINGLNFSHSLEVLLYLLLYFFVGFIL